MDTVSGLRDAIQLLTRQLQERGLEVSSVENLARSGKPGNARLHTERGEIYHLKFTRSGYKPKDTAKVSKAARELDEKLKFAISAFGRGRDTLNGIDEDLLLHLLDLGAKGSECYFITILADGTTLWCAAEDMYEFVMRYDTFFKFPRSKVPVCEVPMGWLLEWDSPITAPPMVSSRQES